PIKARAEVSVEMNVIGRGGGERNGETRVAISESIACCHTYAIEQRNQHPIVAQVGIEIAVVTTRDVQRHRKIADGQSCHSAQRLAVRPAYGVAVGNNAAVRKRAVERELINRCTGARGSQPNQEAGYNSLPEKFRAHGISSV